MDYLDELCCVQWQVASRTYGNSHATLIGLLVQWWIMVAPQTHVALESGPSFGYRSNGKGGGMCDALLCEGEKVLGVVEVEGTRTRETVEKIGKYFAAELAHYKTLEFGMLLLYAYYPKGRGINRVMQSARSEDTFNEVKRVSTKYPEKSIVVITLDKVYERPTESIRQKSEYYFSKLASVTGYLFQNGQEVASRKLFPPHLTMASNK